MRWVLEDKKFEASPGYLGTYLERKKENKLHVAASVLQ